MVQGDGLDQRRHATESSESKRCVTCCRVSRQRARYLALSEYKIRASDLDRLRSDADVNGDTVGPKALEGRSDRLATGSRYQNDFGAAERVAWRPGITRIKVSINESLCSQRGWSYGVNLED